MSGPRHHAPRQNLWGELTRAEIGDARDAGALVLIPAGAIEQHGDHLAVETDSHLCAAVAEMAAARVRSLPVLVAPVAAFGFSPHHLSLPGTISLRLETYLAVMRDIAASVLDAGFARALFVNGHGGNIAPLRALVGQMATDGHAVGMVDYFSPGEAAWAPLLRGAVSHLGHACEYETGLTLALADEEETRRVTDAATGLPPRKTQPWIAPGHDHDPVSAAGAAWPPIFQADDCGYFGDPACASRDGGAALLEVTVARLAAFIEAFAATPLRVGVARDAANPRIAPALAPLRR